MRQESRGRIECRQHPCTPTEAPMAADPKKRQKKLERRAAKRKEKKQTLVRAESGGLPERLSAATRYPVLHCWISDTVKDEGLGWVLLSREFPNGQVAVASF